MTKIKITIRIEQNEYDPARYRKFPSFESIIPPLHNDTYREKDAIPPFEPKKPCLGISVSHSLIEKLYQELRHFKYIGDLGYASFRYYLDYDVRCPDHIEPIKWLYIRKDAITFLLKQIYSHKYTIKSVSFEEVKRRASYIFVDSEGRKYDKMNCVANDFEYNHETFVKNIVSIFRD